MKKYLQLRYFCASKQYTGKLHEKHQKVMCQVNMKLIIFSGQ